MDFALRDMEAARETVAASREASSRYRQAGHKGLADYYRDNAKVAERWLKKAAKVYPNRCDATGKAIKGI